jgi:hypothetical protein
MGFRIQSTIAIVLGLFASPANSYEPVYFRHDHGVAKDQQPLPADFSSDAKQLWRTSHRSLRSSHRGNALEASRANPVDRASPRYG